MIDETAALTALDGQKELLCELAKIFCEDAPRSLETLESALKTHQKDEAHRAAHSIKGQASTFFAADTVAAAARVESTVIATKDEDLDPLLAKELRSSVESLIDTLHERNLVA